MKIFNFGLKNFSFNYYLPTELAYFATFAPIFNLFVIYTSHQNSILYLGQLIGLFYILLTPGLFVLPLISHKKFPFALGIAYSAGISTFLLMFVGLILNFLLPIFGIDEPLSKIPLLVAFDLLIVGLFSLNAYYNKHFAIEIPKFNRKDKYVILFSVLLPLLACMGALRLNNDGDGLFTLIALSLMFVVAAIVSIYNEKFNSDLNPIVLYLFALTFLLMNAMRGWFVSGHDILLEYHVFNLTKDFNVWKMAFYQDPYNACLSLTILPNYLYKLLHLHELYVYKFFIHFLGALPVVLVYYLSKLYTKENIAFLVGLLYITFPTYMIDMAFLNRQGIAFIFFGLVVYNLLNTEYFTPKIRTLILFVFGTGMVFSHYSTSYIAIPLLMGAYVINYMLRYVVFLDGPRWLLKITDRIKDKEIYKKPVLISLHFVLGMLIIMILWSSVVTKTSRSLFQTIKQIGTSLKDPFSLEGQTGPARYSLVKGETLSSDELLKQFIQENIKEHKVVEKQSEFYPLASTQKYPVYPVPEAISPLTGFGEKIQSMLPIDLNTIYINIKQTYAKFLQAFLFIGLLCIFFGYSFKKIFEKNLPVEYLAISFSAISVMVTQTILPAVAINYGLLRLFQQNLFYLSLPILLGMFWVASIVFKDERKQYVSVVSLLLFFYIILNGVIPQITGGTRALMHLSNSGLYYDSYLVHAEEVYSARWISQYSGKKLPVQAVHFSDIKMIAYGTIAPYIELLPETTKKQSFVYLNYDNVRTGNILEILYGEVVYYHFPMEFLNNNKNLIYNNGGSEVYR